MYNLSLQPLHVQCIAHHEEEGLFSRLITCIMCSAVPQSSMAVSGLVQQAATSREQMEGCWQGEQLLVMHSHPK